MTLRLLSVLTLGLAASAAAQPQPADAFRQLVPEDAEIETLATGFTWSEGPVWRPATGDLLFSDVPENTVWRWSDADGIGVYLRPSGRAFGSDTPGETGSNGLLLDAEGRLLLAEHGSRAVTRLDPETFVRDTLATRYAGRRLNSPNDLALHASGALFFTDPPYGLAGHDGSPQKEQPHNGVYRLDPDGSVHLVIDDLTRPNGVALSPDGDVLYVANSDPEWAIWRAYPVDAAGSLGPARVLFDATDLVGPENPGLPDGMAMSETGDLFATGPGGVLVFARDGAYLGTIRTAKATANCTFGDDGHSLYLTSSDTLLRVRLAARGVGF